MNLDSLTEFMNFDPAALLPDLNSVFGRLELVLRILVMAGPALLLAMGLVYLLLSPKEANHHLGYRCYFGMGSVRAWRFTQKLAGFVWAGLGLILGIVMLILVAKFRQMEPPDMVWTAGRYMLWELGTAVFAILAVNITVTVLFDRSGNRRTFGRKEA